MDHDNISINRIIKDWVGSGWIVLNALPFNLQFRTQDNGNIVDLRILKSFINTKHTYIIQWSSHIDQIDSQRRMLCQM